MTEDSSARPSLSPVPRILHYCWFSDSPDKKPEDHPVLKKCLESWKKILPDYRQKVWGFENSPVEVPFVRNMLRKKRWAFASDYVRFHALFREGGLYLDTDMEVLRALPLNRASLTIGLENEKNLNAGILAAAPGHPLIRRVLDFYRKDLRLKLGAAPPAVPWVLNHCMKKYYSFSPSRMKGRKTLDLDSGIRIYAREYFYPAVTAAPYPEETCTVHHEQYSWASKTLLLRIARMPWFFMGRPEWRLFLKLHIRPLFSSSAGTAPTDPSSPADPSAGEEEGEKEKQ